MTYSPYRNQPDPAFAQALREGRVYTLSSGTAGCVPGLIFAVILLAVISSAFARGRFSLAPFGFIFIWLLVMFATMARRLGRNRVVVTGTDLWAQGWFSPPQRVPWAQVTEATWSLQTVKGGVSCRLDVQVAGRPTPLSLVSMKESEIRALFHEVVARADLSETAETPAPSALAAFFGGRREHEWWSRPTAAPPPAPVKAEAPAAEETPSLPPPAPPAAPVLAPAPEPPAAPVAEAEPPPAPGVPPPPEWGSVPPPLQ